jgi:hypothetical protein
MNYTTTNTNVSRKHNDSSTGGIYTQMDKLRKTSINPKNETQSISTNNPLNIHDIDLNNITYTKIKSNQTKKIILLKYNDNSLQNFVIQTPTLLNISSPDCTSGFAEIEVALDGKYNNKIDSFISFLNKLENKIKLDAQNNVSEWFNITETNQTINFQKIIRESTDYSKGTLKIKIIKNNDFETLLQLNNTNKIEINSIPANSWCKMILECYAIWINSNNDFGLFFRPVLLSFTLKEKDIYNYKFIESDEDEIDIPDTEINHNIFMNIDSSNELYRSLTHLDADKFVNDLQSDLQSDMSPNILNLNIENSYLSDSSST